MDLLESIALGGLILFFVSLAVLHHTRTAARKREGSISPKGQVPPRAPAAASQRITSLPGPSTPAPLADDGDDDKYWRRYYR